MTSSTALFTVAASGPIAAGFKYVALVKAGQAVTLAELASVATEAGAVALGAGVVGVVAACPLQGQLPT